MIREFKCPECNSKFKSSAYNARYCSKGCYSTGVKKKTKEWNRLDRLKKKRTRVFKDKFRDFYESAETYKVRL